MTETGRTGAASLSARAREAVLQRIVDRRYAQGARLVEREVAEELGMSRVPVREALRALATEGLLELLPHSGVRVRRLERVDVEHLYEVWEPLAVQASRLAARAVAAGGAAAGTEGSGGAAAEGAGSGGLAGAGGAEGLAALEASLRQAESAAAAGEGAREVAAHTAFHENVVAMAGNPLLARTMEQLSWQLRLLFGLREEPAHMRAQHAEMFRHIAAGDAEAAAAGTLLHVRDSRAVALRSLFGDA
ncbi:GntR family transcriptional regulator [Streptomyces sp. NPDC059352]|uniref:GntR family transcriptional regulator n=1 Tax=Streptomyces sp. NPDC059352 TaxID=3346810 RepID=UPI00367C5B1D